MDILKKIKLLPNAIKGYERSDPYRNGEYKFLRSYIKKDMIIFDVGAHKGEYAKYILSINNYVSIHCFEPSSRTFTELLSNLKNEIAEQRVYCSNFGLSNKNEGAELFIYNELDERNSLHLNKSHKYDHELLHKEKIYLSTLDKYALDNNISKIDFLKIDVEGHETKVIEGAAETIKQRKIKCIQFEYNNNWLAASSKLEDVFNNLSKHGYNFYRLTIWGKIPVRHFQTKLENYKHSNYVAILSE